MRALRELAERRPWAVALFFSLALLLVPYRTLLGPGVPSGRDLVTYFYPLKAHLVEALRAGEMPRVDRFRWGGLPLLSSPGVAAFDPGNVLFLLLPAGLAAKAWLLLRVLLGAAGFAVFLRMTGLPPLSSAFGALAWGASGITASAASFLGFASAHSVLPWFAAALVRARSERSGRSIALLGMATALLLVASVPEPMLCAALLALVLLAGRGAGPPIRERLGAAGLWAMAGLLGALLGAPALGAILVTGREGVRSTAGALRPEFAEQGALPTARLADLFADGAVADWTIVPAAEGIAGYPYFPSLTPGRVAWTLAILGLVAGSGARLRAASLAFLGVLLALGPVTPVFGLLLHAFPFAGSLRYPEKYVVLFGFGIVWLSALGAAALERRLSGRWTAPAFALLGALAVLDRGGVTTRLLPMSPASLLERRPAVLEDLPTAAEGEPPPRVLSLTGYRSPPGAMDPDPRSAGTTNARWAFPWSPGLFGVGTVLEKDYDVTLPRAQLDWVLFMEESPADSPVPLALARAAGALAVVDAGPGPGGRPEPRLRFLADPVPPFRFVRRVIRSGAPRELATRYLRERVPVDAAFLVQPGEEATAAPGRVVRVSDRPSRLELEVEVEGPGPAYLLACRPVVTTREATLDGRRVAVDEALLGFTGLSIPAGRHVVRLQPSLTWLIIATMLSMTGLATMLRLLRRGPRPEGPTS